MINLFWKYKTVDFFDVKHFLPIPLEHLSYLSKVIGIWILHHPLKAYTDLKGGGGGGGLCRGILAGKYNRHALSVSTSECIN
jgi:hypothetical protein